MPLAVLRNMLRTGFPGLGKVAANPGFSYIFHTQTRKGLGDMRKSLIFKEFLVGGGGFEPPTPAV
jgi:hypothetical protein